MVSETYRCVYKFYFRPHLSPFYNGLVYKVRNSKPSLSDALTPVPPKKFGHGLYCRPCCLYELLPRFKK